MEAKILDISTYDSSFSLSNKLGRVIWNVAYWLLFRPFGLSFFMTWRAGVLRMFGAKVGKNTNIYASVKIWAPWNFEIGDYSSLGPGVDCYNQGKIKIGNNSVISQKTYLCASTHDFTLSNFPLVRRPIRIYDQVWVAADAFVGPGVSIGEGAVVGARAAVFKDVEPFTVVGGNPAVHLKKRIITEK
jgi:putative colanic acid biosynthesis acetyltransferase WcaF